MKSDADHRDEECVDGTDYESSDEPRRLPGKVGDAGQDDAGDGQGVATLRSSSPIRMTVVRPRATMPIADAAQCDVVAARAAREARP